MAQSSFPTLISYLFIPSLWESVAGTATGSYLSYPIGQPNQTLTGTTTLTGVTTATGLITANGGLTIGSSNNITLGSGTVAPTVGQIGYTYYTGLTSTVATLASYVPLSLTLPAGVYIVNTKLYIHTITVSSSTNFVYVNLTVGSSDLTQVIAPCSGVSNLTPNISIVYPITSTTTITTTINVISGTVGIVGFSTPNNYYSFLSATRIA
jgi:hypothetical protein